MGTMYLTATICSFFAPSVISHFPSERRALASFAFEFCLFVGSFAFNYPALILVCSVIHGFSLACFWASQGVYLGLVSDSSNRGKQTGLFWAVFMAGNILGNLCAYFIMRFMGFPELKSGWNGSISITFLTLAFVVALGGITLCFLPPAKDETTIVDSEVTTALIDSASKVSIWKGIRDCYYLLTTPKFVLLTFTMFANGYIALFVPSQMNRQVHDSVSVGIFMSIYACSEIVFSKVGAVISDKYGAYYVIIIGSLSQVIGQVFMIFNDSKQSMLLYIIAYIFHGGADSCFQTQALALTLYYFPGLSAVANSCFRLFQFVSGAICNLTTPLYVKNGEVTWSMFMLENEVMWGLLLVSFVCLSVFVVLYKTSIEVDDVREKEATYE
ncbi:tansporter, major facilitor subfamily protein [Blastocystis sp. subtype 4]|uniref:tansporter, major facilitor subfamily protein n=1 Tax=Blastocystis sp. subtype 4 TaxID=944170 RepID=UPI0007117EDE|nr:tansporter, major facilitor subfamily protein [Blastocystis sp. subtype 4]KNB46845.1 tansporter, major facilitor subfamily protein [Blastocystis sp. subtype 4]|eukprot:XP_014530288.1 tansporter, major facilitor subfamily protein [Blastocystis sp. subtype 4]